MAPETETPETPETPDLRTVSEDPGSLSVGSRARFTKYALRDEETGEQYLGPDQFTDAVAPIDEDYVRSFSQPTFARTLS